MPNIQEQIDIIQERIDVKQLGDRLFEVLLILIGHFIFAIVLIFLIPIIGLGDWTTFAVMNSFWVGNVVVGVIMFSLTRKYKLVSFPIGILSAILPQYGALVYLLVSVTTKNSN